MRPEKSSPNRLISLNHLENNTKSMNNRHNSLSDYAIPTNNIARFDNLESTITEINSGENSKNITNKKLNQCKTTSENISIQSDNSTNIANYQNEQKITNTSAKSPLEKNSSLNKNNVQF